MTTSEERHSAILDGISREAFQDLAVRRTVEDSDLVWYLHAHAFGPHGGMACNERCQVVRSGKVEFVTQTDDANSSS